VVSYSLCTTLKWYLNICYGLINKFFFFLVSDMNTFKEVRLSITFIFIVLSNIFVRIWRFILSDKTITYAYICFKVKRSRGDMNTRILFYITAGTGMQWTMRDILTGIHPNIWTFNLNPAIMEHAVCIYTRTFLASVCCLSSSTACIHPKTLTLQRSPCHEISSVALHGRNRFTRLWMLIG
jgi:hypothetical protein